MAVASGTNAVSALTNTSEEVGKRYMLENPIKKKIKRGEVSYGVAFGFVSLELIESCGYLGFDWILIDAEHGPVGYKDCQELVRACKVSGLVPCIKVPQIQKEVIAGYLDAGALGILAPHIKTAADARALVDAAKFPPLGKRGAGSRTSASNYGLTQTPIEYFRLANEATFLNALVEDVEGIENLDEILAVEGIDAVSIGPGDLSLSMGLPGQFNHPDLRKTIDKAYARIVASGKLQGFDIVNDASGAREAVIKRKRLMVGIPFNSLFAGAGRSYLEEVKR